MQTDIFEEAKKQWESELLEALFKAYYNARANKRNTVNQLRFELQYEQHLFDLYHEILNKTYEPGQSICFIVNKPVKREIFAADFRDRVVHHLIYNYIAPLFEKVFINDSYSCRKGKGTHYGIRRMDHFIRSCSENYSRDCYILKLDIKGYFMALNRTLLYNFVKDELLRQRSRIYFDLPTILFLIERTIFNDPAKNCIVKGKRDDWQGLPQSKSLFYAKENCGLPIGNLTSQLFGNVYLNTFDHFVKRDLGIKYYGRYVDDFILIHRDKGYLLHTIGYIRDYLKQNLQLDLHPDKMYLQHYSKGVQYLGAVIKPHRIYTASRTKGNFYQAIQQQNRIVRDHKPTQEEKQAFQSSLNSYLGIMKHYRSYKLRKGMLFRHLSGSWWNYVCLSGGIVKFTRKNDLSLIKTAFCFNLNQIIYMFNYVVCKLAIYDHAHK